MANITQITERLWTGGDLPEHEDRALEHVLDWQDAGITHVIDNRLEWSDEELVAGAAPSVAYLHNPTDDAGQRMPDAWFDRAVGFALAAWTEDPRAGVLSHCHMGINRGPSSAYAILLADDWDPVEAIELIRTNRPIAAVDYAEDALDWWHRRTGADHERRSRDRNALAAWRRDNRHDTVRIIRQIRRAEVGG